MATNPNNAIGTNAAFSGRTSPNAFNDVLAIFGGRGIVTGWECAPSQNMVITVGGQSGARDVAIAQDNAANKLTIDNISQQPIEVEIAAASTTSVSKDCVVAYVDNPPQGEATATDNPGACGIIDVRGSTGEVPTEDQIRSAITADGATGATAYYVVLATITVPAGATTITASNITQGKKAVVTSGNIGDEAIGTRQLANKAVSANKIDFATMSYGGEQIVGTWIDGSLIYRRVITGTTPSNNATRVVIPAGISNIRDVLPMSNLTLRTSTDSSFPGGGTDFSYRFEISITNGNITIEKTAAGWRGAQVTATVYYTKTNS